MPLMTSRRFAKLLTLMAVCVSDVISIAQTENARISGLVTDSSGAVVQDADVLLQSTEQGTTSTVTTNRAGIYVLPTVRPGQYRISVKKNGFRSVDVIGIVVNVQDRIEENFRLQPGSVTESVTVSGGVPLVNTQDATVSTVVDRNFAENLPMNGRSFQTLIDLTPGVVPVLAAGGNALDSGQFSVNGQRADANYWMVDGVSANASSNTTHGGNQIAGASGIISVFGGTNSLVPVDDMQEFRIQTSTFAPEFGRTPGAQISIVTRSGKNAFHGSAFDYLRNDALDANNWFNGYSNPKPLPKAEERQNDFGGTFSGPILRNQTFFFFSYEGLRLRLPTTTLTTVPDASARQSAVAAMQPVLNSYPFDPSQPNLGNGVAQFNASYSNPGSLNDYNLRIDHKLNDTFNVFARYNYSPSELVTRGIGNAALSSVNRARSVAQQLTSGVTWSASPRIVDEFRFNYSKTDASGSDSLDSFGGAVPWVPVAPSAFNAGPSQFEILQLALIHGFLFDGTDARNVQHQFNVVDTATFQVGSHNFKVGGDYRRLTPTVEPPIYAQEGLFLNLSQAVSGNPLFTFLGTSNRSNLLFRNLGLFVQDTWRIASHLTLTYGLRWDTDFAPTSTSGPQIPALANFNPKDFSNVILAPAGTPSFHTNFANIAPRAGLDYQLSSRPNWGSVIRGGFGVFYDLATSEMGNAIANAGYPFFASTLVRGASFPLTGAAAVPPTIAPPTMAAPQVGSGVDPNLKSPYTLEWNAAAEQELGRQQSVSLTYVGAVGRKLLQTTVFSSPGQLNPAFTQLVVVSNSATSDYHALQVQFNRRLEKNLQVLAAYTWSHSIDTASAGSGGINSNETSGPGNPGDRGSSDFDIRQAFVLGATYKIPVLTSRGLTRRITEGWSLQNSVQARTAPPITLSDRAFGQFSSGYSVQIRPDVEPGVPLYLYGSQYPGGKAINFTSGAAGNCSNGQPSVGPFCPPPEDANFNAARQGTLGRNALRGFGSVEWDLGIHREFPIAEPLRMEVRAEMFNVLNHPNFAFSAPTDTDINSSSFGRSSQMLSQYLGSGFGSAGLNSLYQIGGPRSVQLALKLVF
jgi:hypothetical protein